MVGIFAGFELGGVEIGRAGEDGAGEFEGFFAPKSGRELSVIVVYS